jgi:hypothetical protein
MLWVWEAEALGQNSIQRHPWQVAAVVVMEPPTLPLLPLQLFRLDSRRL